MNLLELIDKDRRHISRSSWFKTVAENYLFGHRNIMTITNEVPMQAETLTQEQGYDADGLKNFLDSF